MLLLHHGHRDGADPRIGRKEGASLGSRLGPVLFQLPPNLKKDLDRLRVFLDTLPLDRRFTIEFRHASWFEDDVFDALRARDIALCITEQPEFASPVVATARRPYGSVLSRVPSR